MVSFKSKLNKVESEIEDDTAGKPRSSLSRYECLQLIEEKDKIILQLSEELDATNSLLNESQLKVRKLETICSNLPTTGADRIFEKV